MKSDLYKTVAFFVAVLFFVPFWVLFGLHWTSLVVEVGLRLTEGLKHIQIDTIETLLEIAGIVSTITAIFVPFIIFEEK